MKSDRSDLPCVSKEPSACPGAEGGFVACVVDTALDLPLDSIQITFANESLDVSDGVTMRCTSPNQCNQQYSVTAITTSAGAITERYAYSPYGELTILDSSETSITGSAVDNRYTYTGREWDSVLKFYHFRARLLSPTAGRFLSRDSWLYRTGENLYRNYFSLRMVDPSGNCPNECDAIHKEQIRLIDLEFTRRFEEIEAEGKAAMENAEKLKKVADEKFYAAANLALQEAKKACEKLPRDTMLQLMAIRSCRIRAESVHFTATSAYFVKSRAAETAFIAALGTYILAQHASNNALAMAAKGAAFEAKKMCEGRGIYPSGPAK